MPMSSGKQTPAGAADRGREGLSPPRPPNRTGGFPAYGSPVGGFLIGSAASPDSVAKIQEIYDRMKRFGTWPHIKAIRNIYTGVGSRGFFADAVDHEAFLRDMKFLTRHRNVIEMKVGKARFCQDIGNVHGARDTFREVVLFGPGLHVCITQPAERGKTPCDIHVDTFQQGNLVRFGHCVPLPDHATVAHVISVSPYLAERAKEEAAQAKRKAIEYLKKKGAKVPGL